MTKPPLTLYLAAPRGFCAGVDRAIKIVEMALAKWGAPVYVRHEIVHNKFVVDSLRAQGAVFVEELDECPDDRPVIFSAHGVPKSVPSAAQARNMTFVDATCPLVSKVHIEAERHHQAGLQMVMIGHEGHPETVGTMGQLPEGEVLLVETVADVATITPRDPSKLAFITQTTLSVDDTIDIVAALRARFPAIVGPHKEDICYATTNRQEAVKAIAGRIDALLVIGAPNSSNSKRLVEVGGGQHRAVHRVLQVGAVALEPHQVDADAAEDQDDHKDIDPEDDQRAVFVRGKAAGMLCRSQRRGVPAVAANALSQGYRTHGLLALTVLHRKFLPGRTRDGCHLDPYRAGSWPKLGKDWVFRGRRAGPVAAALGRRLPDGGVAV
mgnify:CR=1 FL=1